MPPVEMPGDTHLDQHHPAYAGGSGSGSGDGVEEVPRPGSSRSRVLDKPRTPEEILRPGSRLGSSRAPGGRGWWGGILLLFCCRMGNDLFLEMAALRFGKGVSGDGLRYGGGGCRVFTFYLP